MKRIVLLLTILMLGLKGWGQINTDQVLRVGQNALYFEDYMLSIQYFNRVIQAKPYLAQPYFFRGIAKLNLDDYTGAEADATRAIELNPFLTDAWEVRGVARQNMGRNADAVADYEHALQLLPRNRQLLFNKALACQDLGQNERADSAFTELLTHYPGFSHGYLGRARLRMAQADTIGAIADIDRALDLNPKEANGYIMRADIAINRDKDFDRALGDLDEAIRLQPRAAGLYVNRAYLRYRRDDFFGAMADFDYAITLDPLNEAAIFNRALLEMESAANDRALEDLDRLIALNPANSRAHYNRAIVNSAKGRYREAADDISVVINEVPDLPEPYFMRSSFLRSLGEMRPAENDYKTGVRLSDLAQNYVESDELTSEITPVTSSESPSNAGQQSHNSDEAARRFASLLTVDNNAEIHEEYNNTAIRGKVQDRNLNIEPIGWMEIAYYAAPSELHNSNYYIKEIDELNATRLLRFTLLVTTEVPPLSAELSLRHFESIDYYNSYLSSHTPRAIDYIGRAMDFLTIHDYTSALRDLDRAMILTPGVAALHMLRAQGAFHRLQAEKPSAPDNIKIDSAIASSLRRKALDDVIADLDMTLKLSPTMAEAWYNKAVALISVEDYTSALAALNHAIELKPEMGEAWFNRGYVYLRLGNEPAGIADLSRAGQLGIVPAYNLLKRISR